MTAAPRLSIGLAVYNGENYLAEALDSLLSQTFGDFELIVSDNASYDATEAICRDYAARDSRLRYVRQERNRGAAWNFSETFRLSRGEYFKWAAHDDLHADTFLARCVERLDDDPGLALCFSRSRVIDEFGKFVPEDLGADPRAVSFQGISRWSEARRVALCASHKPHERYRGVLLWSRRGYEMFGVVRRAAMRQTGLHRPFNGAEKVFLVELSLLGRFAEIDEPLFYSRWHDRRFSANSSAVAQARHVDPSASSRFAWPRQIRSSWGYFELIWRMPLSPWQRVGCLAVFGQYLLQFAKWKRVLHEAATGRGTSGRLPRRAPDAGAEADKFSCGDFEISN